MTRVILSLLLLSAALPAQRTARLTETLRLDATKEDFPAVNMVQIGPREQIAVLVSRENQVRIYDVSGKKLGVVGRTGSGPGEFRSVGAMGWLGDTLWVYDRQLARENFFGPDLKLIRTEPVTPARFELTDGRGVQLGQGGSGTRPTSGGSITRYALIARNPDGSTLGDVNMPIRSATEERPWDYFIARQSRDGVVKRLDGGPDFMDPKLEFGLSGFGISVPFMRRPQVSFLPDGSRYAFMTTSLSGEASSLTVTSYRRGGVRSFTKQIPFRALPVTSAQRDSALAEFDRYSEGDRSMWQRAKEIARSKMPAVRSPHELLVQGLDGSVWILNELKDDLRLAMVLDPAGNVVGIVTPPVRARIRQATMSTIWVTERDADDLTSVVRYRVDWDR